MPSESQQRVTDFLERLEKPFPRTERFGQEFEKNEQGWFLFERDIEIRRALFPNKDLPGSVHDVFAHPAKMQLYLVRALVEYLTEPGDWILDPFGGTGSTALCTRMGRNTVLIDVEDEFGDIIKETASLMVPKGVAFDAPNAQPWPVWTWMPNTFDLGEVRLYIGDNRKVTQAIATSTHPPIKAVITSPPYSTALNPGSNPLEVKGREGTLATYSRSFNNMSQLNPFLWEQAMRTLWGGLYGCVASGGRVAMVNKDIAKSGTRELLSSALVRQAESVGFKYSEWYKWKPPGTIRQETARNKGGTVIEDEDIVIFDRP